MKANKFWLFRILFINGLILFSGAIFANEQTTGSVKIVAYTDYPPYLHMEDGKQSGLYLQIVDMTLQAINQPYSLEVLPFKRGMHIANSGEGIMIGILKNEERAKTLAFSKPFYSEKIVVFVKQPPQPLYDDVKQLKGMSIGTLLGWSYGKKFDKAKEAKLFSTINGELESNFKVLNQGWVDAVVHTQLSAVYIIKNLGLEYDVFLGSEPFELGDIHIATKKGAHEALLNRFNDKLDDPEHQQKINDLIDSYKN